MNKVGEGNSLIGVGMGGWIFCNTILLLPAGVVLMWAAQGNKGILCFRGITNLCVVA